MVLTLTRYFDAKESSQAVSIDGSMLPRPELAHHEPLW